MLEIRLYNPAKFEIYERSDDDVLKGPTLDIAFEQPTKATINGEEYKIKTITYHLGRSEFYVLSNCSDGSYWFKKL